MWLTLWRMSVSFVSPMLSSSLLFRNIITFPDYFSLKSIHNEIARDFRVRILGMKGRRGKGKLHILKI